MLYIFFGVTVYALGLSGGFVFDDYPNIVANKLLNKESWTFTDFWVAIWSGNAGPTGRPVALFTFALDSFIWELNPFPMKVENLLVHILVAFLGYQLAKRILVILGYSHSTASGVAFVSGLVWLVHPINVTSVLYVVQRMNSLSALFTMGALLLFLSWREQINKGYWSWGRFSAVILTLMLAILSKENGILALGYMALLEIFVLRRIESVQPGKLEKYYRLFLKSACVIVASGIWIIVLLDLYPIRDSYRLRDFTVDQRLLTEFRIFFWYLHQLISPNLSELSLYHDDVVLSESLFRPITTFLSLVSVLIGALVVGFCRHRFSIISLVLSVYFVSQLPETFMRGLEIVYEHRVYFSGFWVILGGVLLAFLGVSRIQGIFLRRMLIILLSGYVVLVASQTAVRSHDWSSQYLLTMMDVFNNPNSYRANMQVGSYYASKLNRAEDSDVIGKYNNYMTARLYFEKAFSLNKESASACVAILILESHYSGGLPDSETIAQCKKALEYKVDASAVTSLGLLVSCVENGVCRDGEYVLELLDVAYDSAERLSKTYQALILTERAHYYKGVKDSLDIPIFLYRRATEIAPDRDQIKVQLIYLLLEAEKIPEAFQVARELKESDYLGQYLYIYDALGI